jgi:hypothetical protein
MKKLTTLVFLVLATALVGCAEPKKSKPGSSNNSDVPTDISTIDVTSGDPWTPTGNGPGEGPGNGAWVYGSSAPLEIVSVQRLIEYTTEARNNPTNIRINLNLTRKGSNNGSPTYGGTASISYEDYYYYEGNFTSGDTNNDNKYNVWLEKDGITGFHAFFEDGLGAIIVVIDEFQITGGDGEGPGDIVNGKVYFKNFDPNDAPPGYTFWPGIYVERNHCWFISLGPNDCRSWKSGDGVNTFRAIYPDSGYKLLGTFEGLSLTEAFNGDSPY